MILYSKAKINIGLHILQKRNDGYHSISSLMYPVPLCDIIELQIRDSKQSNYTFSQSGISLPDSREDNLCYKAWDLFCKEVNSIGLNLHLHKRIPIGAGLGGGSSNAAAVLSGLNRLTGNTLNTDDLKILASKLGSDCSFFINSKPVFAEGRGEILYSSDLDLSSYYLILLNPGIHINTARAYRITRPNDKREKLQTLLSNPMELWQEIIKNDFEKPIFAEYPAIENLKSACYTAGAIYSSMSGSGSTVYGIFKKKPELNTEFDQSIIWQGYF